MVVLRDIGKMRRRLVFEEPVETPDGAGGFAYVWVERFSRRGHVVQPSLARTQEAIVAGAIHHLSSAVVTLRAAKGSPVRDVTSKWRVRLGADLYAIGAVSEPEADLIQFAITKGGAL